MVGGAVTMEAVGFEWLTVVRKGGRVHFIVTMENVGVDYYSLSSQCCNGESWSLLIGWSFQSILIGRCNQAPPVCVDF